MTVSENTLRAAICVALKSVSKDIREGFGSSDWMAREAAERSVALAVISCLNSFEIERKPHAIPPARSRAMPNADGGT